MINKSHIDYEKTIMALCWSYYLWDIHRHCFTLIALRDAL